MKRETLSYSEMMARTLLDLAEGEEHVVAAVTAHRKRLEAGVPMRPKSSKGRKKK